MHLFLFGSVARDDATRTSDVDVFIDRDPKQPFGMMKLSGVHLLLEDVLGSPVDVGTRRGLHRHDSGARGKNSNPGFLTFGP